MGRLLEEKSGSVRREQMNQPSRALVLLLHLIFGIYYFCILLSVLFVLLFIETLPYYYFSLMPVPFLAPYFAIRRAYWFHYSTFYLYGGVFFVTIMLIFRVMIDIWLPLR